MLKTFFSESFFCPRCSEAFTELIEGFIRPVEGLYTSRDYLLEVNAIVQNHAVSKWWSQNSSQTSLV